MSSKRWYSEGEAETDRSTQILLNTGREKRKEIQVITETQDRRGTLPHTAHSGRERVRHAETNTDMEKICRVRQSREKERRPTDQSPRLSEAVRVHRDT